MERLKLKLPTTRSLIILWAVGLALLAVVAWGIGWTAHGLFARQATPTPTAKWPQAVPSAVPTDTTPLPAATPPAQPATPPATTSPPTPAPATDEWETVQSGEGLYQVCRRHCSARWPPDDDALTAYAGDVARLNGLAWPNPSLSAGQRLQMPTCPP